MNCQICLKTSLYVSASCNSLQLEQRLYVLYKYASTAWLILNQGEILFRFRQCLRIGTPSINPPASRRTGARMETCRPFFCGAKMTTSFNVGHRNWRKNNAVGTGPSSKPWERMLTAVAAAAANLYAQLASANLSIARKLAVICYCCCESICCWCA